VPLFAIGLSGGVLGFDDLPPTFVAIALAIFVPGLLALGFQALAARSGAMSRIRQRLSENTVVAIGVAVIFVVWSRVPGHLDELTELFRLVPLFFCFPRADGAAGVVSGYPHEPHRR